MLKFVYPEKIEGLEWRSRQSHLSVKEAPQGFVGANPTSSTKTPHLNAGVAQW